ncbi:MAG: ThuA domain-containing protein [Puniceicoccales bacterium]|jgi:type 1 glutamine amidotransferase|nr:ThuA domain-containing protein [Puniceicoccales bacterium]
MKILSFLTLAAAAVAALPATPEAAAAEKTFNVLVYSRTNGFRHHDAINAGKPFFEKQGEALGFGVKTSEDPNEFSAENLKKYQAVVLLNTTGNFLDDKSGSANEEARKNAFEQWVKDGGAVVGLHSATDGYAKWPVFWKIIGGTFKHHPHHQTCVLEKLDARHPAAAPVKGAVLTNPANPDPRAKIELKAEWVVWDEWYVFRNLQRDSHVIFQVKAGTCKGRGRNPDELVSYYEGGEKCPTHPFVWSREFGKGKVFYTSRGHYGSAFSEPEYAQHVIAGLFSVVGKPIPKVDPATLAPFPQKKKR